MNKEIVINPDKEIERLKKEKDELIDRFMLKCEGINAQIRYLRRLKDEHK